MNRFIPALAGLAVLGLTVSSLANENVRSAEQGMQGHATDLSAMNRRPHVGRHHIHHDRGLQRGFSHSRHLGYRKH
jgi:hypothetical protein